MVPPPITPASRRFLPSDKTHPASRPPPLRQPEALTPLESSSSQRQFASTPRFTFGSFNTKGPPLSSSSPFAGRIKSFGAISRQDEEIEEPSSDQEDALDLQQPSELDTLQDPDKLKTDTVPTDPPAPLPFKRRRLHHPYAFNEEQIIISSSPPPAPSPPVTPPLAPARSPSPPSTPPPFGHRYTTSSAHPRFRLTLPTHSSPPSTTTKPAFIVPAAPQSPPTNLPSALLSPHRRGQKYVPGGLASTLRDWVFETSQEASRGRSVGGRSEQESWDVRLQVAETRSAEGIGEATFVQAMTGTTQDPLGKSWVLIGEPMKRQVTDERGTSVGNGAFVGIRKPTWGLLLSNGEAWCIGVDWTVLTHDA